MTVGVRKNGHFCWVHVVTAHAEDSKAFFSNLLGWKFSEVENGGFIILVDDNAVGILMDKDNSCMAEGTEPHIDVVVKVENADAVVEKAKALGGKVDYPTCDVEDKGRVAFLEDPTGGKFQVWEPKSMAGAEGDSHAHGAPTWFETVTTDVEKATNFYKALFGWQTEVSSKLSDYTCFSLDDEPVGGLMKIPPEMEGMPSHWDICIAVKDIEETAVLAEKLGAKLCTPPSDIPGVGRFCTITTPQGVTFSAITSQQSADKQSA